MKRNLLLITLLFLIACNVKQPSQLNFIAASNKFIYNYGRTAIEKDSIVALISPGSYIASTFSGNYCEVYLKGEFEPYNYVSFELDGEFLGRFKIESDTVKPYKIPVPITNLPHTIKIFKESEASNGAVLVSGFKVEKILPYTLPSTKYIEFIGNSITCGAAADSIAIPTDYGAYLDHQNVYFSYGLRVSRALNANFILSSVSGIGIYRNWNDEHIEEPIISEVYENLNLNTDTSEKFNFEHTPDIVSICLGTNDLSEGDGVKPRLPFNKGKFTANYIDFVKTVYSHYPKAQIVLLSSPMSNAAGNKLLISCLKEVQTYFNKNMDKSILIFEFDTNYNGGYLSHPSTSEHQEIAAQLIPFFEKIYN
jgi:hypothetical protein